MGNKAYRKFTLVNGQKFTMPTAYTPAGKLVTLLSHLATVRLHFAVWLHFMAAMLEKTCPVCDKRHTFLLADLIATAAEDREYWFTCPEMVKVGVIRFDRVADAWNAVAESPNGCVRAY